MQENLDLSSKEMKRMVTLFSIIGAVATFGTGLVALSISNYLLGGCLWAFALVFTGSTMFCKTPRMSAYIILYALYILMLYLVYCGGIEGTGPIWIFISSPVTFFLLGLKRGAINTLIFTTLVIVAFYLAHSTDQGYKYSSFIFPSRIVLSFVIVTMLSAVYEYSKQQYNSKLINLAKENEHLANRDPMTNLANRRFAMNQFDSLQSHPADTSAKFTVMLIDVDNFKSVNDNYGHEMGDEVLVQVSEVLSSSVRGSDIVARWGGEEFLIVVQSIDNDEIKSLSQRLHKTIRELTFCAKGEEFNVTISAGVCVNKGSNKNISEFINSADKLLYQAKSNGRDQFCVRFDDTTVALVSS